MAERVVEGGVAGLDAGKVALKAAVLLHDPPWKPWGARLSPYTLEGCTGEYDDCIAWMVSRLTPGEVVEKLRGVLGGDVEAELAEAGLKVEALVEDLKKAASGWSQVKKRLPGTCKEGERASDEKKCLGSHERQSVLLARLLAAALRAAELEDYAEVLEEAAEILAGVEEGYEGLRSLVKRVDRFAAALDRVYLTAIYGGGEGVKASELKASRPVYVNPFNPRYRKSVHRSLHVRDVALYIAVLSLTLAASLKRAKQGGGAGAVLLYSLLYSLLEPLWYAVAGPGYVPVADTRTPHHTVFDHAAAAAAVSNWFMEGGGRPAGCLAIVDLKSVQGWIAEARRLRDLWAASWLASLLAWKTVEPLVEALGPDVLVQPPARLHPFHAASLLGKVCKGSVEGVFCRGLAALLGLPQGWPLDPTVPSTVKLALPPSLCGRVKEIAERGYREAWKKVMSSIKGYLDTAVSMVETLCRDCSGGGAGGSAEACEELRRLAEDEERPSILVRVACSSLEDARKLMETIAELEPPQPLSVTVRSLEEARRRLEEGLGANCRGEAGCVPVELLVYQALVDSRFWRDLEEAVAGLRAAGRRSGGAYLRLAESIYKAGRGMGRRTFYNCHVCGAGAAVVDGEELRTLLRAARRAGRNDDALERLRRLAGNVQGERLCPYCLAKRMLRDLLYRDDLAEKLTGLKMPGEVYERLGRVTVDFYTGRMRVNARRLAEEVVELVRDPDMVEALVYLAATGFTAPNRFAAALAPEVLNDDKVRELFRDVREVVERHLGEFRGEDAFSVFRDRILGTAEALVMGAVHDLALPRRLREEAERLGGGEEAVGGKLGRLAERLEDVASSVHGRRVYALVLSDGDKMGSGVLSGVLGFTPREYVRLVSEAAGISDPHYVEKLARFMEAAVGVYESMFSKEERLVGRTLIVTPSYHQAVSRALAVQAQLDRAAVEALGGLFLYSGGDDAVAILPPVEPVRGQGGPVVAGSVSTSSGTSRVYMEPHYPALEAAVALRRLYWGLPPLAGSTVNQLDPRPERGLGLVQGVLQRSIRTPVSTGGFNSLVGAGGNVVAVVPALAVYGRSTVVLYADVKTPLWSVFGEGHALLDEKDSTVFRLSCGDCMEKDMLLVAGAAGAALLPHLPLPHGGDRVTLAEAALALLRMESWLAVEERRGQPQQAAPQTPRQPRVAGLSSSVFSDAQLYAREALEAALRCRKGLQAVARMARYIVERNMPSAGNGLRSRVEELLRLLGGVELGVSVYRPDGSQRLAPWLSDGFTYRAPGGDVGCGSPAEGREGGDALASSIVFQVFNAARVTRSAR